jgi:hypothetical protein
MVTVRDKGQPRRESDLRPVAVAVTGSTCGRRVRNQLHMANGRVRLATGGQTSTLGWLVLVADENGLQDAMTSLLE